MKGNYDLRHTIFNKGDLVVHIHFKTKGMVKGVQLDKSLGLVIIVDVKGKKEIWPYAQVKIRKGKDKGKNELRNQT